MDIGSIIRRIAGKCPPAAYPFIPVLRTKDCLEGGRMHASMEKYIALFLPEEQRRDTAAMRKLRRDMWYSFLRYHADFEEYFLFRFPRLSPAARREFVTEAEKDRACGRLSSPEVQRAIWDKWLAHEIFADFYHREAMPLGEDTDPAAFRAFVARHPRFIAKPRLESGGHGVAIFDAAEPGFDEDAVRTELGRIGVVCEELIPQAEAMARLHPASVNTVRVASFWKEGEAHILFTFLRMGRSGSIVDNGAAGGFVASLDPATGMVITPGVTETLVSRAVHPDTGTAILGFQVPRWDELMALVPRLAALYPAHPYLSWDFSLTDAGWVLVEVNCMGQFVGPQFTTGAGIRDKLAPYFDFSL